MYVRGSQRMWTTTSDSNDAKRGCGAFFELSQNWGAGTYALYEHFPNRFSRIPCEVLRLPLAEALAVSSRVGFALVLGVPVLYRFGGVPPCS